MKIINNIMKKDKAITLIALVITIVVLIILAGIVINVTLGNNGIINRIKEAQIEYKKAQYFEEINIEILEEQMERKVEEKNELFITSIQYRLGGSPISELNETKIHTKKAWVQEVTNSLNKTLLIDTTDGYEIFIDFDNENNTATIRENSFGKKGQDYTITYNANTGEGTTQSQTVREGLNVTLRTNSFTKTNYEFAGWYKNEECTGERYNPGYEYEVTKNETLYAKWTQNAVAVSFNPGEGSGSMISISVTIGENLTIPTSTLTPPTNKMFDEWKTTINGEEKNYVKGDIITPQEDITLTAQWIDPLESITISAATTDTDLLPHFGKIVSGYNPTSGSNWKLFYADDQNIYLISDETDPIWVSSNYDSTAMSEPGISLSGGSTLLNNLSTSTYSYKSMRFLTNTVHWTDYKTEDAKWAMGGPTLKMWITSYQAAGGTTPLTIGSNSNGFTINGSGADIYNLQALSSPLTELYFGNSVGGYYCLTTPCGWDDVGIFGAANYTNLGYGCCTQAPRIAGTYNSAKPLRPIVCLNKHKLAISQEGNLSIK